MDLERFQREFTRSWFGRAPNLPYPFLALGWLRRRFDPCPSVAGMTSIRVQALLGLAASCLGDGECYLEVGSYQGKTLISALVRAPKVKGFACDDFSQFQGDSPHARLMDNLRRCGVADRVEFLEGDFHGTLESAKLGVPIGLYLYDGAHDEESQYLGIRLAEPLLADFALVFVDDWRWAPDSRSYARQGSLRAIQSSPNRWRLLYELPARYNGDHTLWWNGLAVFEFIRVSDKQ